MNQISPLFRIGLFLLMSSILLLSCSEKTIIRKIPSDAQWAVFVDFKKLALQSFSLSDLLKAGKADSAPEKEQKKTVSWEDSGIDLLAGASLFGLGETGVSGQKVLLLAISDKAAFRNFCLNEMKMQEAPELGKDWMKTNSLCVYLQDDLAIGFPAGMNDSKEELLQLADKIRNLKEEENLLQSSAAFKKLCEEGKSIGFWFDAENAFDFSALLMPADLIRGEITGSVDFRNGEIATEAQISRSDTVKSSSLIQTAISKEMLSSCFSSGNPGAFLAMRISMKALRNLSAQTPYGSSGDMMLAAYGISTEDLEKGLSGELAFAVKQPDPSEPDALPDFRILIGTSDASGKLLLQLQNGGVLEPVGQGLFAIPFLPGLGIRQNGSQIEVVSAGWKKEKSGEEGLRFAVEEPAGVLGGIYFDSFEKSLPGEMEFAAVPFQQFAGFWRSLQFRLLVPDENNTRFSLHLHCRKDDQNSLINLVETLKAMDADRKKSGAGEENPPPDL
jgi:hypothetical protein